MAATYQPSQWLIPKNENTDKVGNYSFEFDGTADYIDLGDNFDSVFTGTDWSLSVWINVSTNTSYDCFFSKGIPVQFYVHHGKVKIWLGDPYLVGTPITSATTLSLDTWYHVAFTRSGSVNILYINGSPEATLDVAGSVPASAKELIIGAYAGPITTPALPFQGSISELSIFNYKLEAGEVGTLWGSAETGVGNPMGLDPVPVAYYKGDKAALGARFGAVPNQVSGDYVFDFNGTSDYIDTSATPAVLGLPATTVSGGSFSISLWYNHSTLTNGPPIIQSTTNYAWNDGFAIKQEVALGQDRLRFWVGAQATHVATGNLNASQWYHVVAVFTGGATHTLELYIDNVLVSTASFTTSRNIHNPTPISMAWAPDGYGYFYDGMVSNAAIWDSALTSGDVTILYNNGTPLTTLADFPASGDVQAWWKLDQSALWNPVYDTWALPPANGTLTQTQAYAFDDSINQYIRNESMIGRSSETEFTFSVWINANTLTAGYGTSPFGTNGSFQVFDDPGGVLRFYLTTTTIYWNHYANGGGTNVVLNHSDSGFAKGGWYNVIGVFESSAWKVFVNGEDYSADISYTGSVPSTMPSLKSPAYLNLCTFGTYYPTGSSYDFDGMVGPIAFWNSEQSANVATIYNGGVPGDLSSLSPNNWWKLDGNATDSGSAGNNGTLTLDPAVVNTPIIASPPIGTSSGMTQASLVPGTVTRGTAMYSEYSFDFDGTGDYFTMGNVLDKSIGDSFSISAWIKLSSIPLTWKLIVSKMDHTNPWNGYQFSISDTNKLYMGLRGTAEIYSTSSTVFVADTWYHVAGTYDGSGVNTGINIYINGVLDNGTQSGTFAGTLSNSTDLQISGRDGANILFLGNISNAAIFSSELSAANILTIYNNGRPGELTSLSPTSWWKMGEEAFCPDYTATPDVWEIPDQIGSNDGTSAGNPDLVGEAPQSFANGLSVSMDIDDRIGESGFSDNNALSYNMDSEARVYRD